MQMGPAEWAMLIGLSLIWGGSFFLNAVALEGFSVLTVVALRVSLGAMALWLVLVARGLGLPRRAWGACLVMGILNNVVPFTLIVWGQLHIASGAAAILNATTPLFGVVVAHFATRDERMTPLKLAGVGIGVAGVAAMVGGAAVRELGSGVAGQLAILGAALCYAVAGVFGRRFARMGMAPIQVAAGQTSGSSVILLPLALASGGWPHAGAGPWAAVLGLALRCTAFAYILYFRLLATSGAVNLLLVTLLVPVSAILLGLAFLCETLEPRHLLGMGAIATGLACIDGRPVGWLRRSPA